MNPTSVGRLLRSNRPLAALVAANGLSSVGDWLYLTAVPIVIWSATEDVGLVAIIAAVRLVPWLLLSVPAGSLADRLPRRRVLAVVESSRAGVMFAMAAVAALDGPLWLLLALALLATTLGTLATPVARNLGPRTRPERRRAGDRERSFLRTRQPGVGARPGNCRSPGRVRKRRSGVCRQRHFVPFRRRLGASPSSQH
jgi:MFS family permease